MTRNRAICLVVRYRARARAFEYLELPEHERLSDAMRYRKSHLLSISRYWYPREPLTRYVRCRHVKHRISGERGRDKRLEIIIDDMGKDYRALLFGQSVIRDGVSEAEF